jgi:hypothetical protein
MPSSNQDVPLQLLQEQEQEQELRLPLHQLWIECRSLLPI